MRRCLRWVYPFDRDVRCAPFPEVVQISEQKVGKVAKRNLAGVRHKHGSRIHLVGWIFNEIETITCAKRAQALLNLGVRFLQVSDAVHEHFGVTGSVWCNDGLWKDQHGVTFAAAFGASEKFPFACGQFQIEGLEVPPVVRAIMVHDPLCEEGKQPR